MTCELTQKPSLRSVGVIAGALGRAGQAGQKRRKAAASNGVSTWEQPRDLSTHIAKDQGIARKNRSTALKKLQANVMGFSEDEKALLQSQFPYEELEMNEQQMLEILGTSGGQGKKGGKADQSREEAHAQGKTHRRGDPRLIKVERELQALKQQTGEIEAAVGGSQED